MSALVFGTPYLAGFFGWITIALGALGLAMIVRLSGGKWLDPFVPLVDALAVCIVPALVLFVPVAIGVASTHPPITGDAPSSLRAWLSPGAVVVRGFVLLALWSALAVAWRRTHSTKVAAAGLPILFFTVSLAGFDWLSGLVPGWASDALGLYWLVGAFAGAVAAVAVLAAVTRASADDAHRVHALGKVLWAGVILWGYIAFCPFLIVWMADLPAEVPWYASRVEGGWRTFTIALVSLHFLVPFVVLFSRALKRSLSRLAVVAGIVVIAHALDVLWCVLPTGAATVWDAVPTVLLSGLLLFAASRLARSFAVGERSHA